MPSKNPFVMREYLFLSSKAGLDSLKNIRKRWLIVR